MWSVNVYLTNNTEYNVSVINSFLPESSLSPSGGTSNFSTTDSPNKTFFSFSNISSSNPFLGIGFGFGENSGVWVDVGYMEPTYVIMDIDVNGNTVTLEQGGGLTVVEDFSSGGDISITFR